MVQFNVAAKGKLSKKQEQALKTKEKIVRAFYDKDGVYTQRRTWKELKRLSKLSSGAVSKHLKDLVKQEMVVGKVIIDEKGSMKTVFEYNPDKCLDVKGDDRREVYTERNDVVRIDKSIQPYGATWGHYKRVRAQTADRKRSRYKPKGQELEKGTNLIFQPEN